MKETIMTNVSRGRLFVVVGNIRYDVTAGKDVCSHYVKMVF